MNKEEFKKLSIDHQLVYLNKFQDLLANAITNRMQLLPIIAGLSATLLVVATFNDKLIPLDNIIRVILSILLLIIPISLFSYNIDLKSAQTKNKKYIDSLLGTEDIAVPSSCKDKIIGYAPDFIIYALAIIVVVIIIKIWT
jgi:hypothetical protein